MMKILFNCLIVLVLCGIVAWVHFYNLHLKNAANRNATIDIVLADGKRGIKTICGEKNISCHCNNQKDVINTFCSRMTPDFEEAAKFPAANASRFRAYRYWKSHTARQAYVSIMSMIFQTCSQLEIECYMYGGCCWGRTGTTV